jgi:simple sugar transport system ATP-binding protein
VLLISDEIPEVLYHSHRVLVMREGRLTTDVLAADTSEDALRQAVNA